MKTTEQIFLETKAVFEQQAVKAMEEAIDKVYQDLLPHVESDTQSNVFFQSYGWINRYLAGSLREDDFKIDILSEDVRKKIWDENKEELKELIAKDVQDRLAYLEKEIRASWEHKYFIGEQNV
jgi:hypothetical protein